ncbi:MAG TPA: argininosuccinate synthase [Ruminococcaceae bacterium]|nr:argininosuccinate synthase [Oscillospiraceae bacterium]
MGKIKKVVLAYSGGLDTSIIIPWLKENYDNCEVIAVCANVGQTGELDGLEKRAKASGASKLYIEDLTDEFVDDYVIPTMQAGADYEGYLLGTSFARPVIAKRLVEIAKAEGADAICHGSTGKGNDQVRFELAVMHFAPKMKIITPWREWNIQSRDEEIDYAEAHNIPLKISRETNYSKDKNLWHLSHEGLDLEDPSNEPQYEKYGFLELDVFPTQAPNKSEYVELEFEKGVPVKLNGKKEKASEIIKELNQIGGKNGIGLYDVVENRLVGMKSRGVYETPGGTILYRAHEVLETLVLDRDTFHKKKELAVTFGELVYDGKWFTPLRHALSAFVEDTQQNVTGKVRLRLYKGNVINAGVWSPYSLYREDIATFDAGGEYRQSDATGFISLYGLPTRVQATVDEENKNK